MLGTRTKMSFPNQNIGGPRVGWVGILNQGHNHQGR